MLRAKVSPASLKSDEALACPSRVTLLTAKKSLASNLAPGSYHHYLPRAIIRAFVFLVLGIFFGLL